MKMAKSNKILLLSIAFFMCIIFSFGLYVPSVVKAQNVSASTYFNFNGDASAENLVLENDKLVATFTEGDIVSTINKLSLDEFAVNFSFNKEEVKRFRISFGLESYDANGNLNPTSNEDDKSYDKAIGFELEIDAVENTVKYNGQVNTGFNFGTEYTVTFNSVNNFIVATVNGVEINAPSGNYYKIKDYDRVVSNVNFILVDLVEETESAKVIFNYFDQMTSDAEHNYKQTFELEDGKFKNLASPVISLYEGFNGGSNVVKCGKEVTVNPVAYALLEKIDETKLTLSCADDNVKIFGQKITFNEAVEKTFEVKSKDGLKTYLTKTILVIDEDNEAPKYKNNIESSVLASFNSALQKSLVTEDGKSIPVGANEYLVLPSLENFVTDNLDGYSSLIPVVYYNAPNTSMLQNYTATTSELKMPIPNAGKYEFFVAFKDKSGNEMEKEQFFVVNDEVKEEKEYFSFVFTFEIEDNADIIIKAKSVGAGYVGVKYVAPGFTVTASSYTQEYKLFYRKDASSGEEGWVEIPKAISITNEDYNENGYTYEDIKNIQYDGEFTFIPNKVGEYKIVCYVTSANSYRSAEGETASIVISNPSKVVVPHNPWLENNVWSVVFLGIGTLCLIGIIILLCIKPKEKND